MDVLAAGWTGSTNLGDELVLRGLRAHLDALGARVTALTTDVAATRMAHGIAAVGHTDVLGTWGAVGRADALVLGGGGILQDQTSAFNLPYHLSRAWLARVRRTPWAAVGVGAGPVSTAVGRRLLRTLRGARAISVRDAPSAAALAACGVHGTSVAADLAFALPAPRQDPADRMVICLRPWGGGGRLPVSTERLRAATPPGFVAAAARALDAAADATGLQPVLVALDTVRDADLHDRIAARMRTSAKCVVPTLDSVLADIAAARVVVGMRFHAGVAAALAGRPAVLIGYAPKVVALAEDVGPGGVVLPWRPDSLEGLAAAVQTVIGRDDDMAAAAAALRHRGAGNRRALEILLSRDVPA